MKTDINTIVGVLKFIEDKRKEDWEDRVIYNSLKDSMNTITTY